MGKDFMKRPPLSWSKSRKQQFDECKLDYWFQYYGYWNGWRANSDPRTKRIYYLRNLTSKEDVVGVIVHDKIKDFLISVQNGNTFSKEALMGAVDLHWSRIVSNTRERKYLSAKNTMAFREVHYGEPYPSPQEYVARTKHCLNNAYKYLEKLPISVSDMFLIDDLEHGFIPVQLTESQSINIYAVIDFCYTTMENGRKIYHITDWKSGYGFDAESPVFQMKVYGLFLYNVHKVPLEDIRFTVVRLSGEEPEEIHYNFEPFHFQEAYETMDQSIKDMLKLDAIYTNESAFKPSPEPNRCNKCKFKEVCPAYVKPANQP